MLPILIITIKGILRDKVFQGIMTASILFLAIPWISSLSMRQVTELSISLCLSLISFELLLLAVFLGGTAIWKDIERRYTFSVLSLPVTRASYVLGKYFGVAVFILLTTLTLGIVCSTVVGVTSTMYPPPRPVAWSALFLAIAFSALKYILLVAIAFFFSVVSTSFFLPIFGTISVFLAGSAIQEVHDFFRSPQAQGFSPLIKSVAGVLYYVLPNFSSFDLDVNAIYGIGTSFSGTMLTLLYFAIYTALLLLIAISIYSRREMQ